jgi:hypothetical protein
MAQARTEQQREVAATAAVQLAERDAQCAALQAQLDNQAHATSTPNSANGSGEGVHKLRCEVLAWHCGAATMKRSGQRVGMMPAASASAECTHKYSVTCTCSGGGGPGAGACARAAGGRRAAWPGAASAGERVLSHHQQYLLQPPLIQDDA